MTVKFFENDERGYFEWLSGHKDGFVVNCRSRLDTDYLVLHRASCTTVNQYRGMQANPGGFTERSYVKLCGVSIAELAEYLKNSMRVSRSFSKECALCKPR